VGDDDDEGEHGFPRVPAHEGHYASRGGRGSPRAMTPSDPPTISVHIGRESRIGVHRRRPDCATRSSGRRPRPTRGHARPTDLGTRSSSVVMRRIPSCKAKLRMCATSPLPAVMLAIWSQSPWYGPLDTLRPALVVLSRRSGSRFVAPRPPPVGGVGRQDAPMAAVDDLEGAVEAGRGIEADLPGLVARQDALRSRPRSSSRECSLDHRP
jgi:hypothetical protein